MKTITLMIFVVSSIAYADKKVVSTKEEAVSAVCKEHESMLERCLTTPQSLWKKFYLGEVVQDRLYRGPGPSPIERCRVYALQTKVCQLEAKIDENEKEKKITETEIRKIIKEALEEAFNVKPHYR